MAEIGPEGILGLNFLQDFDCTLVSRNDHYKLRMGSTWGNMRLEREQQKRSYDHRAQVRQYNRHDSVWLYNADRKKKSFSQATKTLERPIRIDFPSRQSGLPDSAESEDKIKVVLVDRLKSYHGDNRAIYTGENKTRLM